MAESKGLDTSEKMTQQAHPEHDPVGAEPVDLAQPASAHGASLGHGGSGGGESGGEGELNLEGGSLPRFALRNSHTAIVGAMIVALLGTVAFTQMPIDVFPQLNLKAAVVGTFFPGFPPIAIEQNITSRYERFFTLGSGIEHIESRSIPGCSIITVYFHEDVNIDAGAANLATLAMSDLNLMPPGTLPPLVLQWSESASLPVILVAVTGPYNETILQNNARYNVRNFLGTVHGAAVPYPFGGKIRQIMAYVNGEKLQARGLSVMDAVDAVNATNQIVPAGDAKIGNFDWYVYANAEIPHANDLNRVPISTGRSQAPVYLGDVGKGMDAAQLQYNVVLIDGHPSVYVPVFRQSGSNTLEVIEGVKSGLPQVTGLRPGMKLKTLFSQEDVIMDAVEALEHEAVAGSILASLMIYVFLGNFRSTFAIFLSIPLSIFAGVLCLWLTGNTINVMTLGGFTLAIGRLVDDSTVVLENINRHLAEGKAPLVAALEGAEEVTYAVLASTTTTVVVFLPVIFLWGVSKHLFTALALAVTYSMFASYVMAMTIIPLYCSRFLSAAEARKLEAREQGEAEKGRGFLAAFNRYYNRFNTSFGEWLEFSLNHKTALITGISVIFVASMLLFPLLGSRMFPQVDAGKFVINIRTPIGSRLEITAAIGTKLDRLVRSVIPPSELSTVVENLGVVPQVSAIYTNNSGEDDGEVFIELKPGHKVSTFEYEDRVRRVLAEKLPEVRTFFSSASVIDSVLNFGALSPVDVQLSAPLREQFPDMFTFARQIQARLDKVPEVRQTYIKQISDYPTLNVDIDREKAARLGVTTKDVMFNLITALDNNEIVRKSIWIDPVSGADYYLSAQYFEHDINSFETLLNLPVGSRFSQMRVYRDPTSPYLDGSGHKQPVLLRQVANIRRTAYAAEADHYNIQRVVDVLVTPRTKDWGGTFDAVKKAVSQLTPPTNTKVFYRGSVELMNKSFQSFYGGFVLTIIIVYLIGVAQGRSWLDPFIFLFSIPMGLIGVAALLYVTNTTLNIESMMGIIVMIGIVHSNVILLIEFANQRREQGMPLRQAVIEAARIRMRPILMTTLATLGALAPVALKLESGSEASVPLARTVIGGLTVSTFMTLFLAPAVWETFYGWKARLAQRRRS